MSNRYRYEVSYSGGTGWVRVSRRDVYSRLSGTFENVDLALRELHEGHEVRTPFAVYRARPAVKEGDQE